MIFLLILFFLWSFTRHFFIAFKPSLKPAWCYPEIEVKVIISCASLIAFPLASTYYKNKIYDVGLFILSAILSTLTSAFFSLYLRNKDKEIFYTLSFLGKQFTHFLLVGILLKYVISYTNKWRYLSLCLMAGSYDVINVSFDLFVKGGWLWKKYENKIEVVMNFTVLVSWVYVVVMLFACKWAFKVDEESLKLR